MAVDFAQRRFEAPLLRRDHALNALDGAGGAGDLLGPPPVITGEDPNEFLELLDRVREDAKPKRIIAEISSATASIFYGRFVACAG